MTVVDRSGREITTLTQPSVVNSIAFSPDGARLIALTARDREILLACAAGAGLAAVYSVPVGGALFAARILLGSWHPRVVGTALITSSLAVAVASPVTHEEQHRWTGPTRNCLICSRFSRSCCHRWRSAWAWRSAGSWRVRGRPRQ